MALDTVALAFNESRHQKNKNPQVITWGRRILFSEIEPVLLFVRLFDVGVDILDFGFTQDALLRRHGTDIADHSVGDIVKQVFIALFP